MNNVKTIYSDFDGTITKKDMVNSFFAQFASSKWLEYEQFWIDGKISSMENAIKQVSLLRPVSFEELDSFIASVEIDEHFLDFINFITEQKIKLVILSDGFDFFIKKILEKHNIQNVKVFANHLIYQNETFKIEFPYHNSQCDIKAGMCKCEKVKEKEFCYIGDGMSDLCIAQKANLLFATKNLHKYCENNSIQHYYFESFEGIIRILQNYIK